MKKIVTDKIGTVTTKLHDTKTKLLKSDERYHFIKKIIHYTSEEGIHGFFPFYKDENLNNELLIDSFYYEFQKNYLEKLNSMLISHRHNLDINVIEFSDKEVINSIVCKYDETDRKINAIKIKTTKDIYFIGDRLLLNKSLPKIAKEQNFITGLKASFTQDGSMINVSSLQAYFESDDNYHKYIITKPSFNYLNYFVKAYEYFESVLCKIAKFIFIISFILGVLIFTLKSSLYFSGGDILIREKDVLFDLVKIHTDENGFTHIKAKNIEDSYFAIGFTHAKERLWQMDFMRRLARGKLSEIFGEKTLEIDRFIKSIGMNYISEKNSEFFVYNSENYRVFQKYIDGINYYATYFPLPIEYKITFNSNNFKYWEITDSVAISNFLIFTLSHDWENEIWHKFIEENLGKEFADLINSFKEMNHPFSNESVITDDELVELNMHKNRKKSDETIKLEREKVEKIAKQEMQKQQKKEEKKKLEDLENNNPDTNSSQEKVLKNNEKNIINVIPKDKENDIIGNLASDGASNSWVISGKYTLSGNPILSNDPHLTNSIPTNIFVLKLYLPDNTLSGGTVPGNPFFYFGSNKDFSWGITTGNGDIIDICEEKIEDDYYIYDNKRYKIIQTEETIEVKGGTPEKVITKWTRNGPLLNKIHKSFHKMNFDIKFDIPLSIRIYSYLFEFTNFDYYYKVNFASTPQTFIDENLFIGNFHIIWATKKDIGYVPLGNHTVKSYKNRFCRGYSSMDDVGKFLKKTELPIIKNPKKGYIITANNRFVNFNFTYSLTGNHNHVRAYRIRELIEKKISSLEKFDIKNNIDIIQDQKDALAAVILPLILDIFERNINRYNNNYNNENIKKYFKLLKDWDYVLSKNSTEATIYSVLEYNIGRHFLTSKLPYEQANGLMNLLPYWNFVSGIIQKIHSEEEVEIVQCAGLSGSKNCEKYIFTIFNNLDNYLTEFKDSYNTVKKWGDIMNHEYPHRPLDSFPFISSLFSRKISTGGNRNTVNLAKGSFNKYSNLPFNSINSANYKMVIDMGDPTTPYITLNTGNSGNLFSKFYDNLINKNEKGELVKLHNFNFENNENADVNTLVLKPLFPIDDYQFEAKRLADAVKNKKSLEKN